LGHQVQEKLLSLCVKARPLQRISLGGIRDEAQICTYVASSRGFIIQVFHIASCIDPVILLNDVDKLDKVIMSMFQLIYLKIDLSTLPISSTLSSPLLDRCEIVHLARFLFDEKVTIANRFGALKDWDKWIEAAMSEKTLRNR